MKITVTFFAPLFLAAMTFAQEESPAPSESTAPASEEKASATVEETPAEVAPAGQKREEPMITPSPAAATSATKSAATSSMSPAKSTAANPAKPAAAAPATTTGKMTGKNLNPRDAENAWEAAVGKHDYATVEGYVAADFTGVSAKNKFVNRSQMLGEFKGDKDTYKSAKNEKLNVQMYGNNVAVVTGRAREIGTGKDGKAFDRTYLFTDTWMMRGGKWQCVASHVSKIKG